MLVGGSSVGLGFWTTRMQQHDALIINLAGRQRMLSQKMAKEAWLGLLKEERHYLTQMHITAHHFEEGLQALMNGGQLTYAGTTVTVPPATDPAFRAALEEVQATWEPLHQAVHAVLENEPGSPAFRQGMAQLERLSGVVLEEMDAAVRAYQRTAEARVASLRWIQLAFLLSGAVVLVLGYGVVLTQVLRPVRSLEMSVQRMEQGDLDAPVRVQVHNELGRLARAFESMRERVRTWMVELRVLAEISRAFREITDREVLFAELTSSIARLLDAEQCALVLHDEATGDFVLQWPAYGMTPEQVALGHFPAADVVRLLSRVPPEGALIIDDPTREEDLAPELIQAWGERSLLIARLQVEDRVLGGIRVANKRSGAGFTPEDARLLGLIAGQAAIALERAREHQAVKAAEARYRGLFDGVPVGLYRSTPEGQLLDANLALVEVLGYPDRGSLLRINLKDVYVDPADRIYWQALVEEKGTVRDFEVRLRRRDGQTIWVRDNARVVRDADGQVLYYEGSVEDITERKRAEEALRRRVRELATITRVSREITAVHDLRAVLRSIARHAAALSGSDASGVFVFRPDGRLYVAAAYGVGDEFLQAIEAQGVPPGQGAIGRAALERRPVQIPDIQVERGYPYGLLAELENIRAVLAVPMLREEEVIGGIVLWHRQPRRFAPEEVAFLHGLAQQCVNAVENARLLDAEARRRREAETLRDVAGAVNASLDREEVLRVILEQLAQVVDYDSASVMLISDGLLDIVAQRGFRSPEQQFARLQVEALRHVQEVLEQRHPVIIPDTTADARWLRLPHSAYIRCWLGVPLVVQERVIGLLSLDKEEPGFYTEHHAALAVAFAHQAAIAIENARLFEETHRRAAHLEALNAIIAATATALDLPALLETALEHVLQALGVEMGVIWLGPEQEKEPLFASPLLITHGLPPEVGEALRELATAITTADSRQPAEEETATIGGLPSTVSFGIRDVLTAPLLAEGRSVGGLIVAVSEPRVWSSEEVNLLQTVGRQLGTALERLRLFHETQIRAERMARLISLGETLNRPFTVAEVAAAIGQGALALSGADRAAVYFRQPDDTITCLWSQGLSREYVAKVTRRARELPGVLMARRRTPLLVSDAQDVMEDLLLQRVA